MEERDVSAAATRLMTAEEFYVWAELSENAEKWHELDEGIPVERPVSSVWHGAVCWLVTVIIGPYFMSRCGFLAIRCGLLVHRNPDTVIGPDVAAFPTRPAFDDLPRGPATDIPTLVVEVLSPSDRPGRTGRRVRGYLRRGISAVWTVDPEDRTVTVYTANDTVLYEQTEELVGDPELPGFRCRVSDFFSWPTPPKPAANP